MARKALLFINIIGSLSGAQNYFWIRKVLVSILTTLKNGFTVSRNSELYGIDEFIACGLEAYHEIELYLFKASVASF